MSEHENLADDLHTYATAAEAAVEQLATGLAKAGADPAAVENCTKIAGLLRNIATALAKGGTPEHGAAEAAPPETMHSATEGMMADRSAGRPA